MAILFATQTTPNNPGWVSLLDGAAVGAMGDAANDIGGGQNPVDSLIARREARSRLVRGPVINNEGGEIADDQWLSASWKIASVGRLGIVSAPENNGIAARHFSEAVYNNDPRFVWARQAVVEMVASALSGKHPTSVAREKAAQLVNGSSRRRRRREPAGEFVTRFVGEALRLAA
ncbi:MAG: hypothetical protein JNK24_00475 [Alphaproteobacteria bacterium]|nr:hypothetical protein [Alphaproteobacteria bacterium]